MKRLPDGQWVNPERLDVCWVEGNEAFLGIGGGRLQLQFETNGEARKWLDGFMERLALDRQAK